MNYINVTNMVGRVKIIHIFSLTPEKISLLDACF